MAAANLKIGKATNGRYRISFESEKGKLVCEVPVQADDYSGSLTDDEKKRIALQRSKSLARALHEAIVDH